VVSKARKKPSVSKQAMQRLYMKISNLKKLNKVEGKKTVSG
jgi:hypothetical protein